MPIINVMRLRVRYTHETDPSRPDWTNNGFYDAVAKQVGTHIIIKQSIIPIPKESSRLEYDCMDDFLNDFDICTKYVR